MPTLDVTRSRIEMQGYCGLSDHEVVALDPWLRVAPAFCAGWAAAATLAESAPALALLAGVAATGALLPIHPFDVPYNAMVRFWIDAPSIPRSRLPRRLACGVAAVWLAVAATATLMGSALATQLLGWSFTATALVPVLTGLCVPSYVLARARRRLRRAFPARPAPSP